jgi:hypothetical protein
LNGQFTKEVKMANEEIFNISNHRGYASKNDIEIPLTIVRLTIKKINNYKYW